MNPANEAYGQNFVLALYAGVRLPPPPIWGHLQHAWMPDLPAWDGERYSQLWPTFVYSSRNEQAARERARGTFIAIGDPFLYVRSMLVSEQTALPTAPGAPSTILYPAHFDGQDETVPWHASLAADIRRAEEGQVTVCLHWYDYQNANLRAAYADQGFRVITHGYPRSWNFLFAQHAELLRHGRLITNQVGTAMWHGAALGLHVEVQGRPFPAVLPEESPEKQRARWPELFAGGLRGEAAVATADAELGGDRMLSAGDLRLTLGWKGSGRWKARALWPLREMRRRQQLRARPLAERPVFETPGLKGVITPPGT